MKIQLPGVIQEYVEASNRHDMQAILSCFSDHAVVQDEAREYRGKKEIKNWIVATIEKYNFRFQPVSSKDDNGEIIVSIKISGSFTGSPVTPDYHFTITNGQISSLAIN